MKILNLAEETDVNSYGNFAMLYGFFRIGFAERGRLGREESESKTCRRREKSLFYRSCARHEIGYPNMKKILVAAFLALVSFAFVACDNAKKRLQTEIENVNETSCPMDMGMVGELTSVEYDPDENEVAMTVTFSANLPIKPSSLSGMKNTVKRVMFTGWMNNSDVTKTFKDIADAKASLCVVMQKAVGEDELRINVSESEIKDLVNGNIDQVSSREMLELMASITNVQCPLRIDEATVLSTVSVEGDNFVYNYSVDESVVDMDLLQANLYKVEGEVRQKMLSNDPTVTSIVALAKENDAVFVHRYTGDQTGKTCQFKIKASEL